MNVTGPLVSQRIETVRRAARQWKNQLVDVSGRNRLLNYRDLKVGTMDLTPGNDLGITPWGLDSLLSGNTVMLSCLVHDDESLIDARRRLGAIYRRTQEHLDEKGINTLFAASGLATWTVESGTHPNAPVILIPVTASPLDAARWDFEIELGGDPHLNPVLAHVFRTELGIDVSDVDETLADRPPSSFSELTNMFTQLAAQWTQVRGIRVEPRVVLGNFLYTNMPMVADLDNNVEAFAESDLVASIAGVEEARQALADRIVDPDLNKPDLDPPESEFLVLDADASQHRAINRVLGGASEVIWGPPGTGKSQTIANLIACLAAMGRRVLFVAEKRAAIDVVFDRLEKSGLAGLMMDVHGGIKSKREFARSMDESMRSIKSVPVQNYSDLHKGLSDRRRLLMQHKAAMHDIREPWKVNLYEVQAEILSTSTQAPHAPRVIPETVQRVDRDGMDELMRDMREWVDLRGHTLASDYPEWARSNVSSLEEAGSAFELVRNLGTVTLPEARSTVFSAAAEVGLDLPATVPEWRNLLFWLSDIEEVLERFEPGIYSLDHESLRASLAPARGRWEPLAAIFSGRYRAAVRILASTLRDPSRISGADALEVLERVARQQEAWLRMGRTAGSPRVPDGMQAAWAAVNRLGESIRRAEEIFAPEDLLGKNHPDLQNWLDRVSSQQHTAANLTRIRELRGRLENSGFGTLIELVGREVPPESAAETMRLSWLRAVWEAMVFRDRNLAGFNEAVHNRTQREFTELDQRHLRVAPGRVQRAAAEAAMATMNTYPEETRLVSREAAKKTRHLPIRRLFQQAPHVLTAIRPCWAMSPLLVAELIPAELDLFDVVIFDEASQIPPAEAIGVLARAPQAVIAGDDRQLPPTAFFAKQLPEDEDEENELDGALTADIESILDVAKASPIREELLQWHYRSRDERLISFSNHNIYQGALTTFPGIALKGPVSHHLVPFRPVPGRSTTSHSDEVDKVVDMVIDHARSGSVQSLGVITFGIHHADRIDNTLRLRLRDLADPSLDSYFSEDALEKFFVKNIERVQGDERDVIILSVGYHKTEDGTLPYRFGPLNQEGGERRLNVAVTRARQRLHLVSSFSHYDMEPGKSTARGVELLRQYLEFAASGGSELGTAATGEPLNGFELDILNRLMEKGIPVTPQYGVGRSRLDFACAHPDQAGRMVLAIEADGASYHSGHTARDRDRLRQQNLENKGWRFHRIWSTSWFRDREREVERAVAAWKEACQEADSDDWVFMPDSQKENDLESQAVPVIPDTVQRGPKPSITRGKPITWYPHRLLVSLARWILSDTLLRTDAEIHREMREELGFKKGGTRINAALQRAIDEVRRDMK